MHENVTEKPVHARPMRRWIRRVIVAVVIGALCYGAYFVYWVAVTSLYAEENLHATLFTICVVEQFVGKNGRWPSSWKELEQIPMPSDPPSPGYKPGPWPNGIEIIRIGGAHGYAWPSESPQIQKRVGIDFSADPAAIARQDPEDFSAIKPIGPHYPFLQYGYVQSLQKTIRERLRD